MTTFPPRFRSGSYRFTRAGSGAVSDPELQARIDENLARANRVRAAEQLRQNALVLGIASDSPLLRPLEPKAEPVTAGVARAFDDDDADEIKLDHREAEPADDRTATEAPPTTPNDTGCPTRG